MLAEMTIDVPFELPAALEAHEPAEVRGRGRDDVRLLVTSGSEGRASHARFNELPQMLSRGDLLVLNVSATIPAALPARAGSGRTFTLNLSTRLPGGLCVVEPRGYEPSPGENASLPGGASAAFLTRYRRSRRLWIARIDSIVNLLAYVSHWGKPIAYRHVRGEWPVDAYQNVYAVEPGSAEMPSAGRPITPALIVRLREAGIGMASIVLHAGVSSPERDEPPYEEYFSVPHETAAAVAAARSAERRVIAVGTTAVRALESASDGAGRIVASQGWTDLVITPERGVRFVDGMLTGFHEPRSTHLALLETLAGRTHVRRAYDAALKGGYLWHEFGDSHLLMKDEGGFTPS